MKEQPLVVKILIGVAIVLLSTSIIGLFSSYTAVKVNNNRLDKVEKELNEKPDNSVLLQYMELTQTKFDTQQKLLDEHVKSDAIQFEFLQKELERVNKDLDQLREKYLTDVYRSKKKD